MSSTSTLSVSSVVSYLEEKYEQITTISSTILGELKSGRLKSDLKIKHVIKIGHKEKSNSPNVAEDPLMEISVMQKFCTKSHPHFVKLIGAVEDEKSVCIVLEFINGGDLCHYLQELSHGVGNERARKYAQQITSAVKIMHDGDVCHLDLSLENLLFDKENDCIKICDFGLCREMSSELFESAVIRPGKKSYMAPEIYAHQRFDGSKCDVFSLGVIIFILLTGFPPFNEPIATDQCFAYMYFGKLKWLCTQWHLCPNIINEDAIDLLSRIFTTHKKRITIHEMVEHPWFNPPKLKLNRSDSGSDGNNNSSVHTNAQHSGDDSRGVTVQTIKEKGKYEYEYEYDINSNSNGVRMDMNHNQMLHQECHDDLQQRLPLSIADPKMQLILSLSCISFEDSNSGDHNHNHVALQPLMSSPTREQRQFVAEQLRQLQQPSSPLPSIFDDEENLTRVISESSQLSSAIGKMDYSAVFVPSKVVEGAVVLKNESNHNGVDAENQSDRQINGLVVEAVAVAVGVGDGTQASGYPRGMRRRSSVDLNVTDTSESSENNGERARESEPHECNDDTQTLTDSLNVFLAQSHTSYINCNDATVIKSPLKLVVDKEFLCHIPRSQSVNIFASSTTKNNDNTSIIQSKRQPKSLDLLNMDFKALYMNMNAHDLLENAGNHNGDHGYDRDDSGCKAILNNNSLHFGLSQQLLQNAQSTATTPQMCPQFGSFYSDSELANMMANINRELTFMHNINRDINNMPNNHQPRVPITTSTAADNADDITINVIQTLKL